VAVDKHAALLHHLFEMAEAHWIRRVATNAHQRMHNKTMSIGKRIPWVTSITFQAFSVKAPSLDKPNCLTSNATEPILVTLMMTSTV
jgi:hypothetical protein